MEKLTPTSLAGLNVISAGDIEPRFNGLIFGDYGTGKTRLTGSASMVPALSDVLMIDIEGGALTLRNTFPMCKTVRASSWNDIRDIGEELKSGAYSSVRTAIIDSLSEAQLFNMDFVMADLLEGKPDRDENIAGLREWQQNMANMRKFIRFYRDLPMTTIFTALMKEDKDKLTGKRYKRPALPGKLASQVPAMFDLVAYLYVKDTEVGPTRCLLTGATEDIPAKDRSGSLPQVMINPTMTDIYNTMFGD